MVFAATFGAATFGAVFGVDGPARSDAAAGPTLESVPVLLWSEAPTGTPPTSALRTESTEPVVAGNLIFVGLTGTNGLVVLDRRSGTTLAVLPARAEVRASPWVGLDQPGDAQEGHEVIYADSAGYVFSMRVDDRTGEATPNWERYLSAPVLSAPTVAGDTLYLSNVDDQVYALHRADGELRWRYAHKLDALREGDLTLYGAPQPILWNGLVLAGFSDGFLVALDAANGEARWSTGVGEGAYPDLITPALPTDFGVLAGGYSQPLMLLDPETRVPHWRLDIGSSAPMSRSASGELIWVPGNDGILRQINARTGNIDWTWDSGTGGTLTRVTQTPIGLMLGSSEGTLYLIDPSTGALAWSWDPGFVLNGFTAAPLVVGDNVYVLSDAGVLYALRGAAPAAPARGEDWVR